jgi:hypothetical protein
VARVDLCNYSQYFLLKDLLSIKPRRFSLAAFMTFSEIANKRLTVVLIWLALAIGSIYLFIFEPGKSGLFLVCPFYAVTGLACPGCGTTRGLHHLLHGDVITAFRFNPLMMVILPILLYALLRHTNAVMRDQPLRGNQLNAKYIWLLFFVVVGFWIVRNTSFYPFPI